jgi:hypothetical protein
MIEKDGSDFVRIYNDLEKYPALADVALALDISIKTVRNKAGFIRSLSKADSASPKLAIRGNVNDSPMSESAEKFQADWVAEDCIEELRRIAEIDRRWSSRVITSAIMRDALKLHGVNFTELLKSSSARPASSFPVSSTQWSATLLTTHRLTTTDA